MKNYRRKRWIEALKLAKEGEIFPDLVICEYTLPVIDGYKTILKIKEEFYSYGHVVCYISYKFIF